MGFTVSLDIKINFFLAAIRKHDTVKYSAAFGMESVFFIGFQWLGRQIFHQWMVGARTSGWSDG